MTYLKKNHKEVRAEYLHFALPLQTLSTCLPEDSVFDFLNKKLVLTIHCQTDMRPEISLEVKKYLYRFAFALSLFPTGKRKESCFPDQSGLQEQCLAR